MTMVPDFGSVAFFIVSISGVLFRFEDVKDATGAFDQNLGEGN